MMNAQQHLVSLALALCILVTLTWALPLPDKEVLDNTEKIAHTSETSSNEEDLSELASNTGSSPAVQPEEPAHIDDAPDTKPSTDDVDEASESDAPAPSYDEADPMALKDLFPPSDVVPSFNEQEQEPVESYSYPQTKSYNIEETFADTDLSPRSVAEYLLLSGDVTGFQQAIKDLLSAGILSVEDVESYKDAVAMEYESMLSKVMETEADYMQEINEPEESYIDTRSELPALYQTAESSQSYPLRGMDQYDDVTADMEMPPMSNTYDQEESLTQLLETLLSDYYDDSEELPVSDSKGNLDTLIDLVQQTMGNDYAIPLGDSNEGQQEEMTEVSKEETEVSKDSDLSEGSEVSEESEVQQEAEVSEEETGEHSASETESSPEEELSQLPKENKETIEEKTNLVEKTQ